MKKQLKLAAAVAAAAGISSGASAGILSANTWQVLYDGETATLSANAAALYLAFTGSSPPGTPGTGETINITQFFSDGCDASGNNCNQLKNYTHNCTNTLLGDPGTTSTLLALTNVQGVNQPFSSTAGAPGCSLDFGGNGEITGGWIRQELFTHPQLGNIYGVQLWTPPRRTITWFGGSCDSSTLTNAQILAAGQAISDDYDAQIAANGSIPAFGILPPAELSGTNCSPLSVTPFSLGYCDPESPHGNPDNCIANLAKAVPVPAFAAAALGLGLVGVTYLTSRRRKVS